MDKKELDTWNDLYLSVYSGDELNGEYITEVGINLGGQKAVDKVRSDMAAERQSNSRLDAQRAQRFGGVNPVVKAAKGGVEGTLDKTTGKFAATTPTPAVSKPAPTPAPTPAVSRPTTPAPAVARPAATASSPVLSKKNGVEGTGVGSNFKARAFTDTEKSRYASVAAKNAASSGVSKPVTQNQSYEWPSEKEIGNIASAYASIYEAKKKEYNASRDKDGDGDNDFADNMIARMVASGMSREEAIKKVKNKSYNKEEYSLDEETKAEKEARIAARRARVKEMEKEGAVMTSSRRTSEVARQRKEAKKAEALERAASAILNQMHGATGRVSERPMGSQAPKTKEKAPEATRRLNPNLRKDNLGSAADRVLKSVKKEEVELWVNELLEEGYDLSEYTWEDMFEIYEELEYIEERDEGKPGLMFKKIAAKAAKKYGSKEAGNRVAGAIRKKVLANEATAMSKRGHDEVAIRNKIAKSTGGGKFADKATELENRPTYGDTAKEASREKFARAQRGDFRRTTSSDYGLRGYAHQSDTPAVKAKQAARGNQRSALTPREKKMLNREAYEAYELVASYLLENNFATSVEDANEIINNMSENWFDSIIEEKKPLPIAKMKRKETELLGSDEEHFATLSTPMGSPERKKAMKNLDRFDNINTARRSVATKGGKRPLPMPEVGRYRPKDED
jgi:hypothetical protein